MSYWIDDNLGKLLIVGLVLLFAGVFMGANKMQERACRIYEQITGNETRYYAFDTCYVQRDGRWWRWDEYKMVYATTARGAVE